MHQAFAAALSLWPRRSNFYLLPSLHTAGSARSAHLTRGVRANHGRDRSKAFLLTPPTLAQRIVRAKAKIRDTGIRFESTLAGRNCRNDCPPCFR